MSDQEPNELADNVVKFSRRENRNRKPSHIKRREYTGVRGFKPGDKVLYRILAAEPGGFAVVEMREGLPGFLLTSTDHKIGDVVRARYVCIDKNRLLMSET